MAVVCENCNRIYQNLLAQPTKKGEWHIPILEGKAYQVVQEASLAESNGHYTVRHFQYGPFSDKDYFLLKHIRGLERQVWSMGLLCQVLANVKFS